MHAQLYRDRHVWRLRVEGGPDVPTRYPATLPAHKAAAKLRADFPTWTIEEPAQWLTLPLFDDDPAPAEAQAPLFMGESNP